MEIKAGRELDALVAEKVMGLRERLSEAKDQNSFESVRWQIQNCPEYSTDIAAAWEVVEKQKLEVVSRYDERWVCTNLCSDIWACYIDEPLRYQQMNKRHYFEWADTAQHAICLAALRAVGHPIQLALPAE